MSIPSLTVVMPAYNEEGAIAAAVEEVRREVLDHVPQSKLVVVDDGSRDRTGGILEDLAEEDPRVRVVHQANAGHGPAVRKGLEIADGEWLFLVDSDRQIPLVEFAQLREAAEGRDGAFGVRVKREDPLLRIVITRMIRVALRLFFGVPIRDANVPFKLFRAELWRQARETIPEGTLAPSLFLAVFARKRGFDVAEVPVAHRERETGVVSIRRWRLVKFCARGFVQLLAFRKRLLAL